MAMPLLLIRLADAPLEVTQVGKVIVAATVAYNTTPSDAATASAVTNDTAVGTVTISDDP